MANHKHTMRRAEKRDIFPLMNLNQIAKVQDYEGDLFLDYEAVGASLEDPTAFWVVAESSTGLLGVISTLIDSEQEICKIYCCRLDPSYKDNDTLFKDLLSFLLQSLREHKVPFDILYTTTRALTLHQQQLTIDLGFKILGIFPSAMTLDASRLNGLTVWFEPDVLKKRRFVDFSLHPGLAMLYELAKEEAKLSNIAVADIMELPTLPEDPVPPLEMIDAQKFVSRQFTLLKKRSFLSSSSFPFHYPNILITDEDMNVSIFAKFVPQYRFAVIIAEHLKAPANPVQLYKTIAKMLYEKNVSYIEVVIDAADVIAIDSIIRAGYLPCSYFPCFMKHGPMRRDYVIFAKTFERVWETLPDVRHRYLDFLREYYRVAADRGMPLF